MNPQSQPRYQVHSIQIFSLRQSNRTRTHVLKFFFAKREIPCTLSAQGFLPNTILAILSDLYSITVP